MQTLDGIVQGTDSWRSVRTNYFTASEAPAVMGASKYQTRTELLRQKHTGISAEVDDATQQRFNRGHKAEYAARAIVEKRLGVKLYPITGVLEIDSLPLLASFDGVSAAEDIIWETKLLNDELLRQVRNCSLEPHYYWQLEHQLLVAGLSSAYFTASDGTESGTYGMSYESRPELRSTLIAAWHQFAIDLENYQHVEHIPAAVAAPTRDLPALSIQVQGSISLIDNLSVFGARLNEFVAAINKDPTDDQGFADAEAACKTLQAAQDALEAAEASALAQTASIDEMRKTVKLYADTARTTRLALEKMVKARKESIRTEIVMGGKNALTEHIATLNTRLGKPYMPAVDSDFAGVVKGKKLLSALRDAVDTELARCKIEANSVADRIQINLNTLRELAKDHAFLFLDAASLVLKPNGDCMDTIKLRIMEHNAAEAAKEVEARARAVRAAEAAAIAKMAQEEARIRAEERVKLEAAMEDARKRGEESERQRVQAMVAEAAKLPQLPQERVSEIMKSFPQHGEELRGKTTEATRTGLERAGIPQAPAASTPPILLEERPTRAQLIAMVAGFCAVDLATAEGWLISEFAEEVMKEAA